MENDILMLDKAKLISLNLEVYNWVKVSSVKWIEISGQRKNKAVKKYKDEMIKIGIDYAHFESDLAQYFRHVRNLSRQLQNAIINNFNSLDTLILYSDELYDLKRNLKIIYSKHHLIYIQIQRLTDKIAKKKKPNYSLYEIEDEFKVDKDKPGITIEGKNDEEADKDDKLDPDEDEGEGDDYDEGEGGDLDNEPEIQVLDETTGEVTTNTIQVDQINSTNQLETQIDPQPVFNEYEDHDDDEHVKPKKKKKKKGSKKAPTILKAFSSLFGKSNENIIMKPVSYILNEADISLGTINKFKLTCLNDFMLGVELVKNALQCDIRYLESLSLDLQHVYRNHQSYEYVKKCNLKDMIFRCSGQIIENIFKLELECTRYLMEY